jgi:hypothetical protein
MIVLFLDIDGVLNQSDTKTRLDGWVGIDPRNVKILNRLVETINPVIILSSTWRYMTGLKKTEDHLIEMGFVGKLSDATPGQDDKARGLEIQEWLDGHPDVKKFAIIDDNPDMVHLMDYLVQTDPKIGVQDEDVDRLIMLLS